MASFVQFNQLNDDLTMHVVSFAADAPFEKPHERSSLTHVLPLVCSEFHSMCRSEYLWKLALERLTTKDPDLWQVGLLKLLPRSHTVPPQTTNLVEYVHDELDAPSYQDVYRRIVQSHIRVTHSVFCMNGHVRLFEPFGLHFFEQRYRLLIREAMEGFPPEARQGNPIEPNAAGELPTFCYAHMAPFAPTSPACIVQVRTCHMHPDGSADILLVPTAYVWLERMWERPNTGRLYQAQCIRMGREPTQQMEERAFRASERRRQMEMFDHPGFVQDMLQFLMRRGGPFENDEEDEDEEDEDDETEVMEDFVGEMFQQYFNAREDQDDDDDGGGSGSQEEEVD